MESKTPAIVYLRAFTKIILKDPIWWFGEPLCASDGSRKKCNYNKQEEKPQVKATRQIPSQSQTKPSTTNQSSNIVSNFNFHVHYELCWLLAGHEVIHNIIWFLPPSVHIYFIIFFENMSNSYSRWKILSPFFSIFGWKLISCWLNIFYAVPTYISCWIFQKWIGLAGWLKESSWGGLV